MLPFLFPHSNWAIPTYPLIISLSYCLGLLWLLNRCHKKELSKNISLDLSLIIMISGFAGGRLFHALYEAPKHYLQYPLDIFKVWQGGFVFLGGALVATVCTWLYLHKKKENFLIWGDLFAPVCAFVYGTGRIACLLNGCCYGKVCELPWAIEFSSHAHSLSRHPTQIYATLWEWTACLILLFLEKKSPKPGLIFWVWVFAHSIGRLMMEFFRADERGPEYLLSVSSWISLTLLTISSFGLYKVLNKS